MFCKKKHNLENTPQTENTLLLHVKWVVFQANCLQQQFNKNANLPSPELVGWKNDYGIWVPLWMTISEATSSCKELIKCYHTGCTS